MTIWLRQLDFHPLAKYPGPLLWRLSRLPYMLAFRSGRLVHKLKQFHETYGDIVRVAPNELSFTNPDAPRDIYQKRPTASGRQSEALPKDPVRFPPPQPGMPISILDALDADHARIRKAWSSSFSSAALHQQEPLVISYVDKLIAQIKTRTAAPVDLQTWYSYCTFDIIGALSFGDDFGCLAHDRYHEWVAGLVFSIKAKVQVAACRFYPLLYCWLVRWSTSPQATAAMMKHMAMAREKVTARVAAGPSNPHPDFLAQVQRADLSEAELVTNSATMIFAGSHTLQSSLTGITYFLLRNPECLRRVSAELRATIASEADFSLRRLAELPYFNAVVMEGFRITSPVPLNMTRIIPEGGATVVGESLPAGVRLGFYLSLFLVHPHSCSFPSQQRPRPAPLRP